MRALVYGWYSHNNVGDESYRLSLPRLWPNVQFTFTDDLDRVNPNNYDILIVGGGNILERDFITSVQRFKLACWTKPTIAFSVGSSYIDITLDQLKLFDHIWSRDEIAIVRFKALGYSNVTYCPDAAFVLSPNRAHGDELWVRLFRKADLYDTRIIISLNAHLMGTTEGLAKNALAYLNMTYDLAKMADATDACFLFLPFCCSLPWDDRIANGMILTKCQWHKKMVMLYNRVKPQDALDLISAANTVISMRYHATVFAICATTPFIDIYHHDKNKGLLDTMNYRDWGVNYWELQCSKIRELIQSHCTTPNYDRLTQSRLDAHEHVIKCSSIMEKWNVRAT